MQTVPTRRPTFYCDLRLCHSCFALSLCVQPSARVTNRRSHPPPKFSARPPPPPSLPLRRLPASVAAPLLLQSFRACALWIPTPPCSPELAATLLSAPPELKILHSCRLPAARRSSSDHPLSSRCNRSLLLAPSRPLRSPLRSPPSGHPGPPVLPLSDLVPPASRHRAARPQRPPLRLPAARCSSGPTGSPRSAVATSTLPPSPLPSSRPASPSLTAN